MYEIRRALGALTFIIFIAVVLACSQDGGGAAEDAASKDGDAVGSTMDGSAAKSDAVSSQPDPGAAPKVLGLDDWNGGSFVLVIDRRWRNEGSGGPSFPHDELDEEDYEPIEDGPRHSVKVGADGASVEVGEGPMKGERQQADESRIAYDLTGGVFAGGRFVVWKAEGGLEAELTIYGSGVPIVSSERGHIVDAGGNGM
jgi:hypothetical protein